MLAPLSYGLGCLTSLIVNHLAPRVELKQDSGIKWKERKETKDDSSETEGK